ncbi:cytochrome P450 CYP749A22-like [Solanum stenotomum]|uniref:cytochrome P450 CYP749A22-like n=1 Tax=Solanum stenotomum TaxID=172797 RepID=UPI0020D19D0B|nr:cytochrome P450 CYP749A22-like [Solanum stenotomum]
MFENFGTDYLGQLLKLLHEPDTNKSITLDQMIDEIKALYGAGHLTTTSLLGWSVFLLALHPEWQEKARKEVVAFWRNFITSHGSKPYLFVTEPELIKEILSNKEDTYPKMDMEGYAKKLLGESLVTNEGEKWGKVRKLANHTFHAESLKRMVPEMSESVQKMLERWREHEGKEFDMLKDFRLLTTEVISRTAFGSSYMEGKLFFYEKLCTI